MIKVLLIIYNSSGIMIDRLVTPSFDKCAEISARMQMIDFSVPPTERFRYSCERQDKL